MRYQYFVDFWLGISVFANFSQGIAVLGTPSNAPPSVALLSNLGPLTPTRADPLTKYMQSTFKSLGD